MDYPGQLERAFLLSKTGLRHPQREALRRLHDLMSHIGEGIKHLTPEEIAGKARDWEPEWEFPAGQVNLTFELATGVGKTRLMGAIATYLFQSGISENFLFLAPRTEILRKLVAETQDGNPKYMFGSSKAMPQPSVVHAGNLNNFEPVAEGHFKSPCTVYVLTPQLFTEAGVRADRPSPYSGVSLREHLAETDDLIIFFDEAHYLPSEKTGNDSAWHQVVHGLDPRFVFGMTATPRPGQNIAYSYDLRQCLAEGRFTKRPRLILDESGGDYTSEEYDRFTLKHALQRLSVKSAAIRSRDPHLSPVFPNIEPVLLVCAETIAHAQNVGDILAQDFGLDEEEVLVFTSANKNLEDLERLAHIERLASEDTGRKRVKVIVQVHALDEGWDVTNVFVIAPLRTMSSISNIRQVIGRGLRLPAGERLSRSDEPNELDYLDVLAYGQATVQEVVDAATEEFGPDGTDIATPTGEDIGNGETPALEEEDDPDRSPFMITPSGVDLAFEYPSLELVPGEPDLAILSVPLPMSSGAAVYDLQSRDWSRLSTLSRFSRREFIERVKSAVLYGFEFASPFDCEAVENALSDALADTLGHEDSVPYDPNVVASEIVTLLFAQYAGVAPGFEFSGDWIGFSPRAQKVGQRRGLELLSQQGLEFAASRHSRHPVGGWARCTHEFAIFDVAPELQMARALDRMAGVDAWLRNDPPLLTLPTVAPDKATNSVDFIAKSGERIMLIEVKGSNQWVPSGSPARVHARDTAAWVATANSELDHSRLSSHLILDTDVSQIVGLVDLERYSKEPGLS